MGYVGKITENPGLVCKKKCVHFCKIDLNFIRETFPHPCPLHPTTYNQKNQYCILTNGTAVKYALKTEDVLKYTRKCVCEKVNLLDLKLVRQTHLY